MRFDYFYGAEAEQFAFYRIPKPIVTDPVFSKLSIEAKFLYGLLLDRMGMSRKNKWVDEQDRVYIIYAISEIADDMNISEKLAMKYMKELEDIHLLEKQKRGFGFPSILFVRSFIDKPDKSSGVKTETIDNDGKTDIMTDEDTKTDDENAEMGTSGDSLTVSSEEEVSEEKTTDHSPKWIKMKPKTSENDEKEAVKPAEINRTSQTGTSRTSQMVTSRTSHLGTSGTYQMGTSYNNTNINNNNKSNTILSYPIVTESEKESDEIRCDKMNTATGKKEPYREYKARMEEYREVIKQNIDYDILVFDKPEKKQFYDDVVELILEVVMDTREKIIISGNEIPTEIVRSRLLKLDSEHIGYVETSLSKTTTDIKNIKKYLLSALYNAPVTMESYYDAWVKHDMAAGNVGF